MSATPAQIASARQLAQSRGYDPSLVDADNADRANSAFPVKAKGGGGASGIVRATVANSPVDKDPAASPVSAGGGGGAPLPTPAAMPGGGSAPGMAVDPTLGASGPAAGVPSVQALAGAGGGGGADGGMIQSMNGLLRPLGQRNPAIPSMELAQRGRRVY